jgi:GntR family transcriptional regulator
MIEFKLDPKSGMPYYRQIIDQIRYGIASGHFKIGDQLPTVRALAVQLKVNLNTVNKAYKELEIQDILETQQGTGTFIGAAGLTIPDRERKDKLDSICREFLSIAFSYGFSTDEIVREIHKLEGGRP